jgi:hypothetical protein
MNKAQIKKAALDYIALQGTLKDEWYISDKTAAINVLTDFLADIGIKFEEGEIVDDTPSRYRTEQCDDRR